MRILLVGSSREIPAGPGALRAAATELGRELARRGHTIVIGSDHEDDVDPHVVEAALQEGGVAAIEVHVPHGSAQPYRGQQNVRTEWHQFPNWDVTVMEVIRDRVDAVIALGGRVGVIQAGLSAWMLDRPVIPIGSFGGGAKTIWEYSSGRRDHFYQGGIGDAEIDRLTGPWGAEGSGPTATFVLDALEGVARAKAVARVPRALLIQLMAVLLAALTGWVFFLTAPLDSTRVVGLKYVFACVACAGVLGSTLQTLRAMRMGFTASGRKVVIDFGLGLLAGIVSAALYIVAQVAVSGRVQLVLGNEDFVRVALIVSMGSLFSAAYLDRVFSRFDSVSDQIIRGRLAPKTEQARSA